MVNLHDDYVNGDKSFLFAFWHGRALSDMFLMWHHKPRKKVSVLISLHRDGRIIASAMEWLGLETINGSSKRGGAMAALDIIRKLRRPANIVAIAPDGREADDMMDWYAFDLLVVDVMMPGETGIEFTRRLRAGNQNVPVLILTAMGETDDRISGLEAGADDYLPKPFEPRELLLRLNGILRRVMSKPPEKQKAEVKFGTDRKSVVEGKR